MDSRANAYRRCGMCLGWFLRSLAGNFFLNGGFNAGHYLPNYLGMINLGFGVGGSRWILVAGGLWVDGSWVLLLPQIGRLYPLQWHGGIEEEEEKEEGRKIGGYGSRGRRKKRGKEDMGGTRREEDERRRRRRVGEEKRSEVSSFFCLTQNGPTFSNSFYFWKVFFFYAPYGLQPIKFNSKRIRRLH